MHLCAQVNSSSLLSNDEASKYWLDDPCSSFDFFYNTVFIGSLCLFGITSNLLSIVVLYLDRHNRVATFLLRSLAVADISVLLTVFVVLSIFFGTHSVPGFYVQYTRYAIPYLKKVYATFRPLSGAQRIRNNIVAYEYYEHNTVTITITVCMLHVYS